MSIAVRTPDLSPTERVLARGRFRGRIALFGPAFIAAIAYVDPGNFATNVQSGATYGYKLLWVVLAANLMAMPIQYLSAKLGIVTGRDLADLAGERVPRPVAWMLWFQAEIVAMATDLAEFIGAAIGMNLIFGVPLVYSALITAVVAFGVLALQNKGYRKFEIAVVAMLGIILAGFLYDTLRIGPDARGALHGLIPSFAGTDSLVLAVGIVGATAMPHVIYLHSALTAQRLSPRDDGERRKLLRFQRYDVLLALSIAGLINMAMLAIAAKLFYGHAHIDTIEQAHAGLTRMVGGAAALMFAVALLASGISSSSVGTYAGQVVMNGFIHLRISLALRRFVTMLPSIVLLAIGIDPTKALVFSQVLLSFGIPFALIPLVLLTGDRRIMGVHVNRRPITVLAWVVATLIVGLNLFLLGSRIF
ncbi:MAG TPA: Nramp family divalent metal transporter [Mycobacteriales bacterium]|jgi:manganese transport protein|nr:Nramp family divalent metal transporter [Mycobacteriales bacterium]